MSIAEVRMPVWRRVATFSCCLFLLVACSDDEGPQPVGIMWGSGASGAFVNDTISLVVFYRDAAGDPIGQPRPSVTWTSSQPGVVSVVSESLAEAIDTGRAVLTAATAGGPAYAVQVPFEIVPPWQGRLVWARNIVNGAQVSLAVRELPSHDIRDVPEFGYPGQGHGDPYLNTDGSKVAAIAARPTASGAPSTIFIVDLVDGGVTAPLDPLPGTQFAPVWMPGDTLLAFLTAAPTGYEVFTARPDGAGVQQRTQLGQGVPPFFDVTPDNNLILPLRLPGGGGVDLFEVSLVGDTIRRLTQTPNDEETSPSVSPDGSMIAFGTSYDVWIMDRDGANRRPLLPRRRVPVTATHTSLTVSSQASWTPDSRFVLLHWSIDPTWVGSYYSSLSEIYAVRVADGLAIRITRAPTIDAQAVFR